MELEQRDIERFEMGYTRGEPGDCWIWEKGTAQGYGRLRIGGKVTKAHRVAYQLHHGDLDDSKIICHKCDNPSCVNPDHLWQGTHRENQDDAFRKRRKPTIRNIGERNPNSKLTSLDVEMVLYLIFRGYGDREIAKRFGVSSTSVTLIRDGKTWLGVPRIVEVVTRSVPHLDPVERHA